MSTAVTPAGGSRVVNTATLLKLNRVAVMANLNRTLPESVTLGLDPTGFHVLRLVLPFHNGVEARPFPHHRVEALLKMSGEDEPTFTFLDLAVTRWEALVGAVEFLAVVEALGVVTG
jgi:hypothetical protein